MNVLMKIGFELDQCAIERLIAGASAIRWDISVAGGANRAQGFASAVMLVLHHRHGIGDRSERRGQNRLALLNLQTRVRFPVALPTSCCHLLWVLKKSLTECLFICEPAVAGFLVLVRLSGGQQNRCYRLTEEPH
jgi:hypothetical protein